MGGAQPLAATMAGASMVAIECQPSRIEFRLKTRYLDTKASTIEEALEIIDRSHKQDKPISVRLDEAHTHLRRLREHESLGGVRTPREGTVIVERDQLDRYAPRDRLASEALHQREQGIFGVIVLACTQHARGATHPESSDECGERER
jgi:urocanate hydratase